MKKHFIEGPETHPDILLTLLGLNSPPGSCES